MSNTEEHEKIMETLNSEGWRLLKEHLSERLEAAETAGWGLTDPNELLRHGAQIQMLREFINLDALYNNVEDYQ